MNTTSSALATALETGRELVGAILKMSSPASVELIGYSGFDFAIIDTEHGLGGGAELEHHVRAADAAGLPVLVRVGTLDRVEIARALDAGAAGVVVPQIESAEQAREAVRLAHYPPVGARGLATSTRAGHQGTTPAVQHMLTAGASTVVVVQIESESAALAADEILAVPGVSAAWIGLSDLTLAMGSFGDLESPAVVTAVDSVVDAARMSGIPLMVIADDPGEGGRWIDRGSRVLLVNLLTVIARGLGSIQDAHRDSYRERISGDRT